jgi:hypothetical protein
MAAHAPSGLATKGKRLWKETVDKYDLRADELDTLEDICREADLIARLEADLEGASLLVRGSQGQEVVNPIVSEIRQHRATKKALWASLKLPDEGSEAGGSNQQRAAAQSRWAASRGKSA